jgi:hypothetical protein
MRFLHKPFSARAKDEIIVTFDAPTVVKLIHSSQFKNYKKGITYEYRGGQSDKSPVVFVVPFDGVWHAIIEKGTYSKPLDVTGDAELRKPLPDTLNGLEQNETHQKVSGPYDDTLE